MASQRVAHGSGTSAEGQGALKKASVADSSGTSAEGDGELKQASFQRTHLGLAIFCSAGFPALFSSLAHMLTSTMWDVLSPSLAEMLLGKEPFDWRETCTIFGPFFRSCKEKNGFRLAFSAVAFTDEPPSSALLMLRRHLDPLFLDDACVMNLEDDITAFLRQHFSLSKLRLWHAKAFTGAPWPSVKSISLSWNSITVLDDKVGSELCALFPCAENIAINLRGVPCFVKDGFLDAIARLPIKDLVLGNLLDWAAGMANTMSHLGNSLYLPLWPSEKTFLKLANRVGQVQCLAVRATKWFATGLLPGTLFLCISACEVRAREHLFLR